MKTCTRHHASLCNRATGALSLLASLTCLVSVACSNGPSSGAAAAGAANVSSAGSGSAGTPTTSAAGTSGGSVAAGGNGNGNGSGSGSGGIGQSAGTGGIAAGGQGPGGSPGSAGMSNQVDVVTKTTSSFAFKHYPIETNASYVWSGSATAGTQVSTTNYDTVVLENGYLKVTLLPSYGGRILSIIHKPTGRELLYQNPIGTPYLMTQDIFYYDYLVIMGGIFPSFPEPEHGKYWNQPYQLQVVSETPEAVTVRMSRKDDLDLAAGVPSRYDVGRTDMLVELDVTLRAGRSSVQLDTKLTNTKNSAVPKFEYWTVTTLAPGSTPGQTALPKNTRILAKMDKVHLFVKDWDWFAKAEEQVSGEVFKWNNLSHFENWVREGTAFASPSYQANWSGLINYDNDTGILCVSDPVATPGLKLWTFGRDSVTADVKDSSVWLRPAIEMWHGFTPEFWNRGTLAAGEVHKSSTSYFPTLGMKEITAASENGALFLSSSKSGTDTVLSAVATLTMPNQTVKAVLRLGSMVVAEKDVVVEAAKATTVEVKLSSGVTSGANFSAEFLQGSTSLLAGQTTLP
ncbi:MAG TPA: DUF5107 domain-containing protein [Polyangiaceae bacterium]|nr:DUF5107 domain-containing protein [Polyangiaceae bacterium]